jgi:hypothetical protein
MNELPAARILLIQGGRQARITSITLCAQLNGTKEPKSWCAPCAALSPHTHTHMLNEFIRQLKSFNQMIHCVSLPCSMHFNQHHAALSFNETLSLPLSLFVHKQYSGKLYLLRLVGRRPLLCQVSPCRRSQLFISTLEHSQH